MSDTDEDADSERAEKLAELLAGDLIGNLVKEEPFRLAAGQILPPLSDLKAEYKTKSAIIRYLTSLGASTKEIATYTGIRYQHVRNVMTTPLKRGPNEDWRPKPSKG